MTRGAGDRRGVILLVVLFFSLLLTATIVSFLRSSTVDAMVSHNRDDAARAAALARGGVRLAEGLLLQDRLTEASAGSPIDTSHDLWALAGEHPIEVGGGTLRLRIEDSGARLNLNALFETNGEGQRVPRDQAEPFLRAFFEKVIDEIPLPPGERELYDVRELTANLIDWVDGDDVKRQGGSEDEYYQSQDPPYLAANAPLQSLDELRLIEGFDGPLVDAMAPYVTVYPFAPGGCAVAGKGCGVNLNTAPPHVLALLFFDDGVDLRLASEEVVRDILRARGDAGICGADQSLEGCTPIGEIVTNAIFPEPTTSSEIFAVTAEARVGDVRRSVEAVVDRSRPAEPRLLTWRVR